MKRKQYVLLGLMALFVLGTVFTASAENLEQPDYVQQDYYGVYSDGDVGTESTCEYYCSYCAATDYSCDAKGICC